MEREKQWQVILADLENGVKVSNLTAFSRHRITRLGDVVYQLRGKGYRIDTTMIYKYAPDGKVIDKWAEYTLSRRETR